MANYCSIDGCTRSVNSHGLCRPHYERLKKYGDPLGGYAFKRLPEKYPKEYNTYNGMKSRCLNRNNTDYESYGGRGVIIDEEWLGTGGFEKFMKDMGAKPSPSHSLDRIDVNGNYCKDNCRWANPREQALNRRAKAKVKGIKIYKGTNTVTYTATICYKGKRMQAAFNTLKEAISQRKKWEEEFQYDDGD